MNLIQKFMIVFFLLASIFSVYSADLDKERATILELDKQWSSAAAEGKDVDLIVSFWADDAMVLPPGLPSIVGKDAIRVFVQESIAMPGFSIRWETTKVTISEDGTLAYAIGTNKTTFNDLDGQQITEFGKTITIWRKEPSGSWKCVIDIWNKDPSAKK